MASHKRNCAGARAYHETGENPRTVTIRHNPPTTIGSLEITEIVTIRYSRPPTMARSESGEIVTILHGRPPTTKTAKITEIVTILHNPKPPGSATVRMRIIIILRGVAKGLRMRIIIILRVKMRIILTRKNSTKTLIRSPLDPKYNRGRTLNTLATGP